MFPENDNDFTEFLAEKVEKSQSGWQVTRPDGWCFFIGSDSPVEPTIGTAVRTYGKLGFAIRGIFMNGEKVFYRTESEEKEHSEIQMYGADAADWLGRWDAGKTVWTVEMGGLGPGYEQCIHIACAEMLRSLLERKPSEELFTDPSAWDVFRSELHDAMFEVPVFTQLGLSGAQYGAALQLATEIYRNGPRSLLKIEALKDRHIMVQKSFPSG